MTIIIVCFGYIDCELCKLYIVVKYFICQPTHTLDACTLCINVEHGVWLSLCFFHVATFFRKELRKLEVRQKN